MTRVFFCAFLVAGLFNFACSVLLMRGLAKAGVKVSFFEIRWQVHKHMKTYRRVTKETSGKVAWPYYGYQVSLAAMIGFGLLTLYSYGQ